MGIIFVYHKPCYLQQTRFVCQEDSVILKCCNLFFYNSFCFLIDTAKILPMQISSVTLLCNLAFLSLFFTLLCNLLMIFRRKNVFLLIN